MDLEDLKKQYEENEERKKIFSRGFRCGEEHAKAAIKQNEMLRTLLLEFIGYDDAWITTAAGYKKYNKNELIKIIFKQRSLMNTLYNKVEESEKEELRIKIEKFF